MLYIVLVLVLGAFGLLIGALTTANTLFAWISVAVSVVAAGLLIFDWLSGRRRVAATSAGPAGSSVTAEKTEVDRGPAEHPAAEPSEQTDLFEPVEAAAVDTEAAEPDELPADPPPRHAAETPPQQSAGVVSDDEEPAEEPTDATDLLVVSELTVEVRVVDEHPRYHLIGCTWLSGRSSIPIAVAEARQLGFTPCVRCGPDAELAGKHRTGRGGTA